MLSFLSIALALSASAVPKDQATDPWARCGAEKFRPSAVADGALEPSRSSLNFTGQRQTQKGWAGGVANIEIAVDELGRVTPRLSDSSGNGEFDRAAVHFVRCIKMPEGKAYRGLIPIGWKPE